MMFLASFFPVLLHCYVIVCFAQPERDAHDVYVISNSVYV